MKKKPRTRFSVSFLPTIIVFSRHAEASDVKNKLDLRMFSILPAYAFSLISYMERFRTYMILRTYPTIVPN